MKRVIQSWLQRLSLGLLIAMPCGNLYAGTIVIGATGVGNIDGLYLGNATLGAGNDNYYGFGAVTVDQFDPTLELEEYLIDPLDSLGELRATTLTLGLDVSIENLLSIQGLSRIDTLTYLEVDHLHAGLIDFATSQASTVSVVWAGSATATAQIRDVFNTVLWSSAAPEITFQIEGSQYFIDYQVSSRWRADSPGDSLVEGTFNMQLTFAPQDPPPPPPPPNPPPNPVPEPGSLAVWALALGTLRLAKRRLGTRTNCD
jgi:hypothetical protein